MSLRDRDFVTKNISYEKKKQERKRGEASGVGTAMWSMLLIIQDHEAEGEWPASPLHETFMN